MSIRPERIRAVGCSLVAIGFLWLVAVQLLIRPRASAVMIERYQSIEPTNQFSGDEVRKQVFATTQEMAERIPPVLFPSIVMLTGAILIDSAFRRVKGLK